MRHAGKGSGVRINLRRWGTTVVLRLEGRLTVEGGIEALGDLTEWMGGSSQCLLILDLGGVTRMDCAGLGQLVHLRQKVRRRGRSFGLINLERRQKCLVRMAGLADVLRVFDCPLEMLSEWNDHDAARR